MTLRFPTLFQSVAAAAQIRRAAYWGHCPHCRRTTPWLANAMRGAYRCGACGGSVIGG